MAVIVHKSLWLYFLYFPNVLFYVSFSKTCIQSQISEYSMPYSGDTLFISRLPFDLQINSDVNFKARMKESI